MIFNDQAKERFETFVIGQLKHLLACILDPAVLGKHLRIQADREKLG